MSVWTQHQLVQSLTAVCKISSVLASLVQCLLAGKATFTSGAWLTGCSSSCNEEALQWTLLRLPDEALDNKPKSMPLATWLQGLPWPEAGFQDSVQKEVRSVFGGKMPRKRWQQLRRSPPEASGAHNRQRNEDSMSVDGTEDSGDRSDGSASSAGQDEPSSPAPKKLRGAPPATRNAKAKGVEANPVAATSAAVRARFGAGPKAKAKAHKGDVNRGGSGAAVEEFPSEESALARRRRGTRAQGASGAGAAVVLEESPLHKSPLAQRRRRTKAQEEQARGGEHANVLGSAASPARGHTDTNKDMTADALVHPHPAHPARAVERVPSSLSPAAAAAIVHGTRAGTRVGKDADGTGAGTQVLRDAGGPRRRRAGVSLDPAFLDEATQSAASPSKPAEGGVGGLRGRLEGDATKNHHPLLRGAGSTQSHSQARPAPKPRDPHENAVDGPDGGSAVHARVAKPAAEAERAGVGQGDFAAKLNRLLASSSDDD
jgi:hypothetical protein